jgi:drug/metabolite transporter superfamily protein YnfA
MQVTDEETGHQKFAYRFFQFWASKTDPKPNRNRSVWAGFGSGLFVFFSLVWLFFMGKNRTEPKMITPTTNY